MCEHELLLCVWPCVCRLHTCANVAGVRGPCVFAVRFSAQQATGVPEVPTAVTGWPMLGCWGAGEPRSGERWHGRRRVLGHQDPARRAPRVACTPPGVEIFSGLWGLALGLWLWDGSGVWLGQSPTGGQAQEPQDPRGHSGVLN